MNSKARIFVVTLLVLFAMVLATFANPMSVANAQGKTMNVAFSQEPNTMSPFLTQSAFATWAVYLQGAHFYDYDEKFKPHLVLAAEVPTAENGGISKDGKTYTLKLKKDLKWSDGSALTADDMAFTLQMLNDKANNFSQFSFLQGKISKVTVKDPTTVEASFADPQPFPEQVVGPGFIILPSKIFKPIYDKDKSLENADANNKPTVFSGPYTMTEWKRGEQMTFQANPNYVLGKPKIDKIVIKFFKETTPQYQALAAGQIDWIPNLQPADGQAITDLTKDVTFFSLYGSYREYLVFNLSDGKKTLMKAGHPALQDVNVRKAFRLGIDRQKLVKEGLNDLASVSDSLYDQTEYLNPKITFTKYDAAAAEKLLDDAGWKKGSDGIRAKDGVKLELSYVTTTAAQRKRNQAIIQQDLAKIGIKVNLDNKPASDFFAPYTQNGILSTGAYQLSEFANNTVTTNPANATARGLAMCEELVTDKNPGGNNNTGYCNEKDGWDKLQLTTENSLDAKERLDAAFKLQEIFDKDVPFIILYNRDDIYAYATSKFASKPRIGAGIENMWFDVQNWELK